LWTGYGNALVAYADGAVTPAARFAFGRGAALAPDQPAARYFLALADAQAGDLDGAEAAWRAIDAEPSLRPVWRALVRDKLAIVARLRAAAPTP
jgi:cytochrome c-type biogenesis protein CcmH